MKWSHKNGIRKMAGGILVLALLFLQAGCFWKLWSKEKPLEERVFDVYGAVESVTQEKLIIQSKGKSEEFAFLPSSIKGNDFAIGALVHVYYKVKGESKEITMVVEKVNY